MIGPLLSVILDIVVLIGLGVTIYYCIRLSKALSNFRKYRQEFNTLVGDLSRNIEQAQEAIRGMKDSSFEAGEDLQKVVNNARKLADELQLMNDMGNSLANRLERLSENGRGKMNEKPDFGAETAAKPKQTAAKPAPRETRKAPDGPSFFIQDRDFERGESYEDDELLTRDLDDDGFDSQAERDLYEALMKNNKKK